MFGRFDDQWLCESLLFPEPRAGADAVLSLYKDKTVVALPSALETFYAVVPDTAASSTDASVEKNLAEQFGLRLAGIADYRQEELLGRTPTFWSFNHSWALKPLAERLLSREAERPVLLRLDAHDDLASPMVGVTDAKGVFVAPVGDSTLDLRDGASIDEFVLRGFVGIGSFITPLLHALTKLDIVHVAQEYPAAPEELELLVECVPATTFTGRQLLRPSARVVLPSQSPRIRYTRTSDVGLAMDRTTGRDFVLDIDLDYFCNALDNKRLDAAGAPAPAAGSGGAARLLEELALVLEANRVAPCLVAIALSPGFFPSDEWSTVIPRLRQIITAL